MFPDAEGWETVDPDETAKWSMGSEFPPDAAEQSQSEAGAAAEMPTGTNNNNNNNNCGGYIPIEYGRSEAKLRSLM